MDFKKTTMLLIFLLTFLDISYGQKKGRFIYVPIIDGKWWDITNNPDIGKYNSPKQQTVDFGVWQAADGSIQLWSCIRATKAPGFTRLFYRWEGRNILDTAWIPKGIAMEADTTLGEAKGGLQAPFVLKEKNEFYMFYGDWNRICLAKSTDGKNFKRVLNKAGNPSLFEGPMICSRDPMVIKIADIFYCYYAAHIENDSPVIKMKTAVFCRTSKDLKNWSEAVIVSSGGSAVTGTRWHGGDAECPFVVKLQDQYVLFRNQDYGKNGLNTQYSSKDPLDFGADSDRDMVGQLPIAAPEVIKIRDQYYIVALKPGLNGMRVAKLSFVRKQL